MSGLKLAGAAGALVLGVAAAAAAAFGDRGQALRTQVGALGARAHTAQLDLYAIDAHLAAARSQLASLQRQAAHLQHARLSLSLQLAVTRRTFTISQQQLAANLRTLYEQGDTDPLAVVLGAHSLDEAVTRLDDLKRVTDQSRSFVEASSKARARLARLRESLAADRARIDAATRSAETTAARLAATRSDRLAFIARLRSEQQLKAAEIRSLEATVRKAEAKSHAITAKVLAPAAVPAPIPLQATTAAAGRTLTVVATGYSLPGHTATGLAVGWGVVAVDPSLIPLGTRLTIPGYGNAVAADVGSGVHGAMIDLWFPTLAQARAWGRRTVTITLH